MKRLMVLLFVLAAATGTLFAAGAIKNPDTLIYANISDEVSLDPAVAYDNASWSVLAVMYDRLLDFKGTDLGSFVPKLATDVPTVANGGISKRRQDLHVQDTPGREVSERVPPHRGRCRVLLQEEHGDGP